MAAPKSSTMNRTTMKRSIATALIRALLRRPVPDTFRLRSRAVSWIGWIGRLRAARSRGSGTDARDRSGGYRHSRQAEGHADRPPRVRRRAANPQRHELIAPGDVGEPAGGDTQPPSVTHM